MAFFTNKSPGASVQGYSPFDFNPAVTGDALRKQWEGEKAGSRSRNLQSMVFDRLTVIEYAGKSRCGRLHKWRCLCECGNYTEVTGKSLLAGKTRSCGCISRNNIASVNFSHGMSKTPEYRSWAHMIGRCFCETDAKYPLYGGRGITVCDRWKGSFENFFSDMGVKPSKTHSIDRIDNDGDYEPGNCRWATAEQQGNNTRLTRLLSHQGKAQGITKWAREAGISRSGLERRLNHGWEFSDAITVPMRGSGPKSGTTTY